MGKLVAVANYKGGCGKSMTAVNLAVMRAVKLFGSERVVRLIDADQQQSVNEWASEREEKGIEPSISKATMLGVVYKSLLADRAAYDTVIVDVGGHDSPELRQVVAACDVLVVPVRGSAFDAWALNRMAAVIQDCRNEDRAPSKIISVVIANPQTTEGPEMRDLLAADYGDVMPPMETILYERVAYRSALRGFKGIADGTTDTKALQELTSVYREIFNDE